MKKIFMSVAFAAFFGMLANAQQNQSGVYFSQNDFENNKLTYASNAENKIRFNEFLDKPFYKSLNVSQGKGIRKERKYFYSTSGSGEIIPLTVNNLRKSFPDKYLLHNFLDAQFRSNSELSQYDSYEKYRSFLVHWYL